MDFKNVPKRYRPIPFWSWNEKLNKDETVRQINMMEKAGMGGFFMHARNGLQTEYMGEEWFENVSVSINEAKKLGMRPWAYDENGWPSGFGNGAVNGLGVEYQQKYLRMEDSFEHKDSAICKSGDHYFYYDVNPFYVDNLDKKVVAEFINRIYQPYYDKFQGQIEGFFTDEPQLSDVAGIPWSFVLIDEYKIRYNEDLTEHLEELFLEIGNYKDTRFKFWKMITDLFSSAYFKQIYDWCEGHGLKLTGHINNEIIFYNEMVSNGACMPHYEYFHIPGIDWLGRNIGDSLIGNQLGSSAAQLSKEAVLSESFALCGHNVSFDELRGIYEWQMVRGVDLLCQHLEGYSNRGIRKRDYPPAMYYQQPWWDDYDKFNESMSRIGMVLNQGKEKPDTLIFHPISTAWILYNDRDDGKDAIYELNDKFLYVINKAEAMHIDFHLGDETLMERHAFVENGEIVIGDMRYSKVVMPPHEIMFPSTKKLLKEFEESGGKILTVDDLEENPVIDNEKITYTVRYFDDFKVHYFVNTNKDEQKAVLGVQGKKLNIFTGELEEQKKEHTFEPWGSLMIIDDGTPLDEAPTAQKEYIFPDGEFGISGEVENALTLDMCDYYFDGVLEEKNGYVLNIAERANELQRKVEIKQDYFVKIDYIPEKLHLVCEKPENFEISVNGQKIDKTDLGYFRDISFRRIDISKHVKLGGNKISFKCDFVQSKEFYANLEKAKVFESEKNKLVYDMEIEAIYLVGSFGVRTDGNWECLPKEASRYTGDFVIDKMNKSITLDNIQKQGFPFFAGTMTVEKEVEIGDNTYLKTNRKGVNVVKVSIDGKEETMLFGNGEFNLSALALKGKHTLKITMSNNLRNLLGPHHLKEGESYSVRPMSFFKEKCIWNYYYPEPEPWSDGYCFVDVGIN